MSSLVRLACDVLIISADGEERLVDRFRLSAPDQEAAELEIMDIIALELNKREPPPGWALEYRGSVLPESQWSLLPAHGD